MILPVIFWAQIGEAGELKPNLSESFVLTDNGERSSI